MEAQTLGQALERFCIDADQGIGSLNRTFSLCRQWLRLQAYESLYGFNPFEKPERVSEPKLRRSSGSVSLMPYSDLVMKTSSMLDEIMGTLSHKSSCDTYDLSDSEDEDAMKSVDFDSDDIEASGKTIPDWASGDRLQRAVMRQNMDDGYIIFQSMDRRCDLQACFDTTNIPYYNRRRV